MTICVQGDIQERYFELAETIWDGKCEGEMVDHEDTLKRLRQILVGHSQNYDELVLLRRKAAHGCVDFHCDACDDLCNRRNEDAT